MHRRCSGEAAGPTAPWSTRAMAITSFVNATTTVLSATKSLEYIQLWLRMLGSFCDTMSCCRHFTASVTPASCKLDSQLSSSSAPTYTTRTLFSQHTDTNNSYAHYSTSLKAKLSSSNASPTPSAPTLPSTPPTLTSTRLCSALQRPSSSCD